MIPEITSRMEEIESTITWMKLLAPHSDADKKILLMEMHMYGGISDDVLCALVKLCKLVEA